MAELEEILNDYKVCFHSLGYGHRGKPVCSYYIESNMIPFNQSWDNVLKRIMNHKE